MKNMNNLHRYAAGLKTAGCLRGLCAYRIYLNNDGTERYIHLCLTCGMEVVGHMKIASTYGEVERVHELLGKRLKEEELPTCMSCGEITLTQQSAADCEQCAAVFTDFYTKREEENIKNSNTGSEGPLEVEHYQFLLLEDDVDVAFDEIMVEWQIR